MAEHLPDDAERPYPQADLYRWLAENLTEHAVFVVDAQRRVRTWTAGAQRLLGYREEEILGRLEDPFFTPEDRQAGVPQQELQAALATGRGGDQRWRVRRDGSRFWGTSTVATLQDDRGKLRGFAKILRDSTERRRAEMARLESEASKAAVLETALDGIITIDHEDRILEFNPAAESLFGYRRADVLGQKLGEKVIPSRFRAQHYQGMARYLATGQAAVLGRRLELSAMRADGTEFPIELAIVRVPTDQAILFTGYVRDITDRKALERRRSTQLAVTQVLAEASAVGEALPHILQRICVTSDWDVGVFWLGDPQASSLRCLELWHPPGIPAESFERASRERRFPAGTGLPGRVWSTGSPLWIADVARDTNFPRLMAAAEAGLHAAFAVPLALGDQVLGVMEFLSQSVRQPDEDLLGMMTTIGGQIGQFIQQKHAEEALRQSEERFRGLMEQSPFSVQIFSPDGQTLQVNRAWEKLWGVTLDQIGGYNILQDPQLEAKGVLPVIRRAFAGEAVLVPAIQYDPSGALPDHLRGEDPIRWVSAVAYPLKDPRGRIREVVLVHDDITAKRRAEQALQVAHTELEQRIAERTDELARTNQFLRALLESIHEGIVACDAEGRLTLFNRAAAEFHGMPQEPVGVEDWARHYDLYEPDGATRMRREQIPLFRALAGERVQDAEMVIAPKQRPARTLLASGQAFYGQQGDKLGAVVSMRDITQRKQAEEALRRTHEQLETRVAERTAELGRANEALKDADRRKDEFLAMLAHELRNPLAPIRSGLELLEMLGADADILDTMNQQVAHLTRLVDDLLDVSRIIRGRVELRREPVALARAVARAVDALRATIDAQQQQLTVAVPPEPIWLDADPVRLAQVITNLLNNASKYTPAGGKIWLTAQRQQQEVWIRVRDSGIGIDAELLPHIFDLFTQAPRSIDRSQGGLGIGLTVVKSLVEMHRGSVAVASPGPGQGSEFSLRLPTIPAPDQSAGIPLDLLASPRLRVLVVDDNRPAAQMLARLLAKLGEHQVFTAHDGATAIEAADEHQPQLILLDIGLPGIDGFEVARRLRQRPGLSRARIVALTGYGSEQDRRRSIEAGFDEHLVKPLGAAELQSLLARAQPDAGR